MLKHAHQTRANNHLQTTTTFQQRLTYLKHSQLKLELIISSEWGTIKHAHQTRANNNNMSKNPSQLKVELIISCE